MDSKDHNKISSKNFKPYIPADKSIPEFTVPSIILGCILAVVFGAANSYLGLKAGMTIAASIPAAVISMGVMRLILKRDSILENNIVQTVGSAGESVAAGCVFTLPALFMWAEEWGTAPPSIITIAIIAFAGGVLGILFMIPLRRALIVKEHGVLPYPEGTACAEVLLAGEEGGSDASLVFGGLGIAAIFKIFTEDGLNLFKANITTDIPAFKGAGFGISAAPALLGVGYICGFKISAVMFAGSALSWLALMPLISFFGGNSVLYPGTNPISTMTPDDIWSNYIRYIGAGAVATAGIISIAKSIPMLVKTFADAINDFKTRKAQQSLLRTDTDISIVAIGIATLSIFLVLWLVPQVQINFIGALLVLIFGFFFVTVTSKIVGYVGASNNPASGMTIASLLFTAVIFLLTGTTGQDGMIATMSVGALVCIMSSIAADTSQDLKTGYIVGATPKKQQIGEIFGVAATAIAVGAILYLLNSAWGFGSTSLPAPQATLMKVVVEGVMGGNLPWTLIFIGAFIAVVCELIGIATMPFAVGMYLPIGTNACIFVGGIIKYVFEKVKVSDKKREKMQSRGLLFSSGMIAGEGLIGILLAILTIVNINGKSVIEIIRFGTSDSSVFGSIGGLVAFAILIAVFVKISAFAKDKKQAKSEN